MKTIGIIAEYNPFHKGHEYQIQQLKKKTGADYVIIAMSGDFLQRGVPSIVNKYARTKMALSAGADIVFELPAIWATSSAEHFASGGVKLMEKAGVTNYLGFGAECEDLSLLSEISHALATEDVSYQERLKENIKKGMAFPKARSLALGKPEEASKPLSSLHINAYSKILETPNNILAIEYLKALERFQLSSISPVLIPRKGDSYHEKKANSEFASATAIREIMLTDSFWKNPAKDKFSVPESTLPAILPETTCSVIQEYMTQYPLIKEDDISQMLFYALFSQSQKKVLDIADCSKELWNRICKNLLNFTDFTQFTQLLKTKELTYTRISRALLHVLLNYTNQDYALGKELDYIPYLRVLGFRKTAEPLLSAIKKEASVPLITKAADASKYLSSDAMYLLEKDFYASHLYRQLLITRGATSVPKEYTQRIVIIP